MFIFMILGVEQRWQRTGKQNGIICSWQRKPEKILLKETSMRELKPYEYEFNMNKRRGRSRDLQFSDEWVWF